MKLLEIVDYLDRYLAIGDFDDKSDNGLQVEGNPEVGRVAFAVDAGLTAFEGAAAAGADLLIVHHGLFWQETIMVRGYHLRRLQSLLSNNLSLYGAHLPLDTHPVVGNNVEMARILGLDIVGGFGTHRGLTVGLLTNSREPVTLEALRKRLSASLGAEAAIWPFRDRVEKIGVLAGQATGVLNEAIAGGLDALVCGELGHMAYHPAKDANLGVVLGGHYHTETLGVKALMGHIEDTLHLETVWVDAPTGL